MDDGGESDLALLIRYIAEIDGIHRIRFTTSHPLEFNEHLVDVYGDVPELVNHLHLPVQSGSDRILELMKRRYSVSYYRDLVLRLRRQRPRLSLSSDFIIGFPGETDADFDATMALVEDIGFDQSFSFIYSPRPGTPASELPDSVCRELKQDRLRTLQSVITDSSKRISEGMLGSIETILVDRHAKKDSRQLSGRTENNRVVNFDGPAHLIGQFVNVIITEALPNSLRGRLDNPSHQPQAQVAAAAVG
jgi:tRNA-2-methylthio-N6-dimethylallyladenosine synthase